MHTHTRARSRVTAGLLTAGLTASLAASLAVAAAPADAASHQAARGGRYQVTAKASATEPVLGQVVKIKGKVSPAAAGQKVQLEVLYANRKHWKTIGSDALNARSRFKLTDKVGSVRVRKYRVVKAATHGHAAGRSQSLTVTVFGWRTLTSLQGTNASGMVPVPTASINGVVYPSSLWSSGAAGAIDYNLNHGCKTLQATFGLDDSSPTNATASLGVSVDGVVKYSGDTFGLTQSAAKTIDVTNAFRISLGASTTNGGRAVVGSPMVLCDF